MRNVPTRDPFPAALCRRRAGGALCVRGLDLVVLAAPAAFTPHFGLARGLLRFVGLALAIPARCF